MMSAFIPVMFIAVGALMLFALYLMAMRSDDAIDHRQRLKNRLLSTAVFIVFFCQPTAVKEALALFTCVDVDGKSLLYAAVEIDCRSTSHIRWLVFAAVSLAVFVAGLPLLVYWRMRRVREAIIAHEEQTVRQWGFLTNNIEAPFFYWELVSMERKLLVMVVVTLARAQGVVLQALLAQAVMTSFMGLHFATFPYSNGHMS